MSDITIPERINQIIALFHRCGMWQQEDQIASRKMWRKFIYLIFYVYYVISLAFGGFISDDKDECIFLFNATVLGATITVKLIYILLKKRDILTLLHDTGVHSVADRNEFTKINKKVKNLMKFISFFTFFIFLECVFIIICLPLFSTEKILPLNIAFPLDWKNSKIVYWMAYIFVTAGILFTCIVGMLNFVIWYLMMNCSIKYQILGNQFRNIGSIVTTKQTDKKRKITEAEKRKLFSNELIGLIKIHQSTQRAIDRFKLCFSDLFFVQITTSGISLCGSVYVLSFSSNENVIQNAIYVVILFYNLFDIFMVMFFGNEIKLLSHRLLYCLFESNWIGQPETCKKCIIILSEILKQPHELVIVKLYPLDLETFLAILRLAYSMFNILRNLK